VTDSAIGDDLHLVVFDVDGTLVESAGIDADLYARAVREVLGRGIDETWRSYRHVTDGGILEEIFQREGIDDRGGELARRVHRRFVDLTAIHLEQHPGAVVEVPGAREWIEALGRRRNVRLAIATGGWRETAEMKLRAIGLRPEHLVLATGSDARSRTDIMRLAERRALGPRKARRRTYFGDGPWDLQASRALGYEFVAVGTRLDHPRRIRDFLEGDRLIQQLALGEARAHDLLE